MAKQQAVGRFWELLQDFVVLTVAPRAWCPPWRLTTRFCGCQVTCWVFTVLLGRRALVECLLLTCSGGFLCVSLVGQLLCPQPRGSDSGSIVAVQQCGVGCRQAGMLNMQFWAA
jgi:hypothetical protein